MRWEIARKSNKGLSSLRHQMDELFNNFFEIRPGSLFESQWVPEMEVTEDGKGIHVKAEVPGMDEKSINVTLENNVLTLSGEKKEESKKEKQDTVFTERKYGSFSRSITLPKGIRSDQVKAEYKQGILTIDLPKDESAEDKKIKIDVK